MHNTINSLRKDRLHMQKPSIFKQSHWRWVVATVAIMAVIGAATFTFLGNSTSASAAHASPKTVTVWLQATDSCMEALPGAAFIVNGSGIVNRVTGTTPGTLPVGVPTYVHGHCPVDRGTCVKSTT